MSHKTILIIDDENDIREVASLALETGGDFDVLTAAGGVAGLVEASARRPDLILLDVMMPELDGPSTFRRLQELEETRPIPVIFLTAKVQPSERRKLAELGALGIIAKPFDPMRLADEIAAIAGWN
ncbi:MAG TPA: response regulator [Thermoanaerobaculia bacterium]|nr:response regulator [Thermoanaerobaculia bacterium]